MLLLFSRPQPKKHIFIVTLLLLAFGMAALFIRNRLTVDTPRAGKQEEQIANQNKCDRFESFANRLCRIRKNAYL